MKSSPIGQMSLKRKVYVPNQCLEATPGHMVLIETVSIVSKLQQYSFFVLITSGSTGDGSQSCLNNKSSSAFTFMLNNSNDLINSLEARVWVRQSNAD